VFFCETTISCRFDASVVFPSNEQVLGIGLAFNACLALCMVTLTADDDESKADRGSRADESSSESESEETKKAKGETLTPQDAELEAAIAAIRATKDLPRPPYPNLPNLNGPGSMQAKVNSVQTYIEKLQYNFTGVNYFDIRKNRPMT